MNYFQQHHQYSTKICWVGNVCGESWMLLLEVPRKQQNNCQWLGNSICFSFCNKLLDRYDASIAGICIKTIRMEFVFEGSLSQYVVICKLRVKWKPISLSYCFKQILYHEQPLVSVARFFTKVKNNRKIILKYMSHI